MATGIHISEIVVEGLHDQFDVELQLTSGLNVIYGKNGRGKTTMLHLIANLLELDFQRFKHLQFHRISLRNSENETVDIVREPQDGSLTISINGSRTSYESGNGLSEAEVVELRQIIGGRATYLPAFRSILERTRSDSGAYLRATERRDQEFELLVRSEFNALRAFQRGAVTHLTRQLQDEANTTAEKTALCRQWFGSFVPIIRYPSVGDVEDALSEEWRRAQIEITGREQRMFEETFVKVFRVSAGLEHAPSKESNEDILASITELLKGQEDIFGNFESRDDSLLESARSLGASATPHASMNSSLLEIYRQALEARNNERRAAFQKSREFEESINKFLDRKTLSIGRSPAIPRSRSVVSVTTDGGQSYGLSALSSGERQILTMLYSASRSRFISGMFLIDEPELSLHIDWQRIILRELIKQSPDRQIIACTHSPEVGADHIFEVQDFDPKNSLKRQQSLFEDEEI